MTNTPDLSILIPARNEMFLARTIQDILEKIEGNTEIIAVLDGIWANPPVQDDDRVTLIYHNESIGQRAATNEAAQLSRAKYLMKCDAHCSFDKGFDIKMTSEMQSDWTMVPLMKNLHAFDWICENGHRRYQGKSGPCTECGKPTTRDVVWIAKESPKSISYCFDSTPHFQYFGDYSKRPEGQGEITETMSLQGSCWMLTREKYWELGICDEAFGSWGSQGIEVAVKTWLSGGRVLCNKKTWYAHMFRTQGGDFGFPYPISGKDQEYAKKYARDLFFNNKWPLQKKPLSWLVEKFWPVKGWTNEDLEKLKNNTFTFSNSNDQSKPAEIEPTEESPMSSPKTKGIIYYSDSELDEKIAKPVRDQLQKISSEKNIPIVSATLKKLDFGVKNIRFPSLKKSPLAMFTQILGALENSKSDIIFFCEHDVFYHPSHFDFTPDDRNSFYYNQNVWFLRKSDGHTLHYDVNQLSGLCGFREELITHFRERVAFIKSQGYSADMGFEPMTHQRIKWQTIYTLKTWKSEFPNIDVKHGENATKARWQKEEFRNQQLLINWQEGNIDSLEGWQNLRELLEIPRPQRRLKMLK